MAPNDYTDGTGDKSQARPFTDESGLSRPHTLTAVQARQGVISGRIVKVLGISISLALLAIAFSCFLAF